jgi:CDP-diacylglycerol--glycerol-3-phosphate 3-phosphatidyltransferase
MPAGGSAVPTIYDLKPRFKRCCGPWLIVWPRQAPPPMALRDLGGARLEPRPRRLACASAGLTLPLLLLPVTLFLRMALNAIDGMMAREHGMKSPEGAVLNELGDVISDAARYLPFALVASVNAALVVLVVIAAIVGEMAGARADAWRHAAL